MPQFRDNIQRLTNGGIARIAHKAGVLRISSLTYEEIRGVTHVYLQEVVHKCVSVVQHDNAKTVQERHVRLALESLSRNSHTIAHNGASLGACRKNYTTLLSERRAKSEARVRRTSPGVKTFREIKHYSNDASTCFAFAEAAVSGLVRELARESTGGLEMRFSSNAVLLLQLDLEIMLVELFADAKLFLASAGTLTVQPKHIQYARRVQGIRD